MPSLLLICLLLVIHWPPVTEHKKVEDKLFFLNYTFNLFFSYV